jgi:GNAT superfamily N-acetyltransferase
MKKLTDYGKISRLTDQISVEKPYPLSILEGIQNGEIFVDDVDSPTSALIWHYCGFANILGDYNERFIEETVLMMRNPLDGHSGRLALQAENDLKLQEMILKTPGVSKYDRYIFEFRGEKNVTAPVTGLKPEEINADNYDLMRGWIVPTFSWENKNAFLEKGFGYCLIEDGRMAACAFSAGVSKDYVDIGVETAEECRGKGYGKIVASAMVKETLRRGKTPSWGCDTRNEASMKIACSVGFEIIGTHPWYKYEG